ncbi:MAG TPA: DUF2269 family protein [Ktedonobacterales bacterium]
MPHAVFETIYHVALFLHILGALLLSGAKAISYLALMRLRRADRVEQLRAWAVIGAGAARLIPLFALLILIPGVFMMWTAWGWVTPWVDVSLATFLVMMVSGALLLNRQVFALRAAIDATRDGPLPAELAARIASRALWGTENTFTALLIAVLFLMTVRPGLAGALATLGVALAAGVASALRVRPRAAALGMGAAPVS